MSRQAFSPSGLHSSQDLDRIIVSIVDVSPRVMSCGASMMEVVRGEVLDKYDGTPGCARRWDYEEVGDAPSWHHNGQGR